MRDRRRDTVLTAPNDAAEAFSDAVLELRAGLDRPGSSQRVTVKTNVNAPAEEPG